MQFSQNFYNLQSFSGLNLSHKKIGILGGSFNPPHEGHLAISLKALEMGLDYILWLVTPQNNLKPTYEISLDKRIEYCCKLTQNIDKIIVSNLELDTGSTNSFDTLKYLTEHFPDTKFIWLMGVDCLKEFHLWENYAILPELVDMIIFNRRSYTDLLESSIAGKMLKNKVTFVPEILSGLSSTEIRKNNHHPEAT
jgi:nicotinate-nucleotide adenylyltransferase